MKTYDERTQNILQKAEKQKKKNSNIKIWSVTASVLALVLAFNLMLFVPYRTGGININAYSGSQYYPVIKQLSSLTYEEEHTTNNFNEWFGSLLPKYGASAPGDSSAGEVEMPDYVEITNNQTNGVIEGDLFKRSTEYIYYLGTVPAYYDAIVENGVKKEIYTEASYSLRIYSIDGLNSEMVAEYAIKPEAGTTFSGYSEQREMFLSADCNRITVVTPCYNTSARVLYTAIIGIDVSDITNITEVNRVYVSGQYVSSRVTDSSMLIISNFTVRWHADFSDEAQFLPQVGTSEGFKSLPIDNIVYPDNSNSANYSVICSINPESLEVNDCVALLSYSEEVYVSENNLFVTRGVTSGKTAGNLTYSYPATNIYRVSYSDDGLELNGSTEVEGMVNDRYSLDEYEGVLRVFTTTCIYSIYDEENYLVGSPMYSNSASLYCIDVDSMQTIASVYRFAPDGDSVKSARFNGTTAYVCTAEVTYTDFVVNITDPVYVFDLSDYTNITYKDTGTIPGYSLSLITFTDDTLLGIGFGDSFYTLKIELYREYDNDVQSVTQYISEDTEFSKQFKAYFIDRQNGLIGLGLSDGEVFGGYLLLRFDGYNLVEVAKTEFDSNFDQVRATYIDGYLYLFGSLDNMFKVIKVN